MPIIPGRDPNEAYNVVPMKVEPHSLPADWWTATCNGIPVYHFAPANRAHADRYVADPVYRLSMERRYLHDKSPRR